MVWQHLFIAMARQLQRNITEQQQQQQQQQQQREEEEDDANSSASKHAEAGRTSRLRQHLPIC